MAIESTTAQGEIQAREKQATPREGTRPGPTFQPRVDIVESPGEFIVTADLPGVDEQHVDVRLEQGVLSIDGTLAVQPDPDWTPLYGEYRLGGYHREFALSEEIDASGIRASMRDGVLELRLPKTERHRVRRIDVRGA
jgi:HSP20 family molecular chaperone IbpA